MISNYRCYYARPILDRILASYTHEYEENGVTVSKKTHLRLTDMDGNRPELSDLLNIPKVFLTYLRSKINPILDPPVPFLNCRAASFLASIISREMKVIEFGGGNSTLWFLKQGVNLTTFELNEDWRSYITTGIARSRGLNKNDMKFSFKVSNMQEAVDSLRSYDDESFDLAFIDNSGDRMVYLEHVLPKVRKGGWICFDNTDNPKHADAQVFMRRHEKKRFIGYSYLSSCKITQTCFWHLPEDPEIMDVIDTTIV